ncbi:hypothetical protein GJ496_009486 [Pomphorhynchus laevis]|nr:hypothetical protein GJ496_009486 [Pomphorhynchus laevis]
MGINILFEKYKSLKENNLRDYDLSCDYDGVFSPEKREMRTGEMLERISDKHRNRSQSIQESDDTDFATLNLYEPN